MSMRTKHDQDRRVWALPDPLLYRHALPRGTLHIKDACYKKLAKELHGWCSMVQEYPPGRARKRYSMSEMWSYMEYWYLI